MDAATTIQRLSNRFEADSAAPLPSSKLPTSYIGVALIDGFHHITIHPIPSVSAPVTSKTNHLGENISRRNMPLNIVALRTGTYDGKMTQL